MVLGAFTCYFCYTFMFCFLNKVCLTDFPLNCFRDFHVKHTLIIMLLFLLLSWFSRSKYSFMRTSIRRFLYIGECIFFE